MSDPLRIGYIAGQPKRINERVIDGQWVKYLGVHTELVHIPPLAVIKMLGGTVNDWISRFPTSLYELAEGLTQLCGKHRIETLYMNLPAYIPYLLMARNYAGLNVGFLFLAHSVGSEFWLRQWVSIAPWLTERDVLLASTESSRRALQQISDIYRLSKPIPLCTDVGDVRSFEMLSGTRTGKNLLSIGRIEEVKNIHVLLECFAEMRNHIPDIQLTIAGEYTGTTGKQMDEYRKLLGEIISRMQLEEDVTFTGPVNGEQKDALFRNSDLLINLSTDPGETFGFNLIEAKVWGLPVVCSDWDGFQEIVTHGEDGYFVDCEWEGGIPVIDRRQVVVRCLQILQNPADRMRLSKGAFDAAGPFDYRHIFPQIVSAIAESCRHTVKRVPHAVNLAVSTISELPYIYHSERLSHLPFYRDRLISISSYSSNFPLHTWMPLTKPIIHHFAGRGEYAKL